MSESSATGRTMQSWQVACVGPRNIRLDCWFGVPSRNDSSCSCGSRSGRIPCGSLCGSTFAVVAGVDELFDQSPKEDVALTGGVVDVAKRPKRFGH